MKPQRIKLNLTPNTERVPINHYEYVTGFIHSLLGESNPYHGGPSDYSISPICGGKLNDDGATLSFKEPFIVISTIDGEFMKRIIEGVLEKTELGFGMKVTNMNFLNENFTDGWNHFFTISPFILREYIGPNQTRFVTMRDDGNEALAKKLAVQMRHKLKNIDSSLKVDDLDVHIPEHPKHKTKRIEYNNVINLANQCKVSVRCNRHVAETLYHVGIGQSTGACFGLVCKTENLSELYR